MDPISSVFILLASLVFEGVKSVFIGFGLALGGGLAIKIWMSRMK